MRTTIDIPDSLFRQVKACAALRGASLKSFITETLRGRLERELPPRRRRRLKHPLVPSKHPGSIHLTNAMIEDLLAEDDLRAVTRR